MVRVQRKPDRSYKSWAPWKFTGNNNALTANYTLVLLTSPSTHAISWHSIHHDALRSTCTGLNVELAKISFVKWEKERETGDDSVSRLVMTVVKRRREL
jgi:hypothetical protein